MSIAYTLMIEEAHCGENTPCEYDHQCNPQHRKVTEWVLYPKMNTNIGPIHGHLNRLIDQHKKYHRTNNQTGCGRTGNFEIVVINTEDLKPLWSDAEKAAYRIGGLEAVKRLQKARAAEARGQERLRLKAEKETAKKLAKAAAKAAKLAA